MERYAHITGWGMSLPDRVITNQEMTRYVDTSDDWIYTRTGIRERRIAGPKDTTASMAVRAAQAALDVADVDPAQIDLIIVATSTPEYTFPATACLVQDALGATNAGAFDLSAACTGFIYALAMGASHVRCGAAQKALIIGSETLSRVVNWHDRTTCVLFGDGAGAFLLEARDTPGGVLSSLLRSDGSGANSLIIPGGGSRHPASIQTVRDNLHSIRMDGKEVYRFATRVMASAVREAVADAGLDMSDVQLVVPHQANSRIIESAARSLGLPEEKFVVNIDRFGNTSTASIPIAVCEAVEAGRLRPDDNMVMVGFGAGLTWGAVAVSWEATPPVEISTWHRLRRRAAYEMAKVRSATLRGVRRVEGLLTPNGNGRSAADKEPADKLKR